MSMTREAPRLPIRLMIGAHLALGSIMAIAAALRPGYDWPIWIHVWFMGLIGSEMLLLGIWAGFSGARWRQKVAGVVTGIGWIVVLVLSPSRYWDLQLAAFAVVILFPGQLVVACACRFCHRWLARLQWQQSWPSRPAAEDLRFTSRSVIGVTATVSVLLALGRIVRASDYVRGHAALTASLISIIALLSTVILVWACLSQGRAAIRIPTALLGMGVVGLVFPYFIGGPPRLYAVWPALTLVVSAYVVASLLVVRGCGYRLVPVRSGLPQ